MSRRRAGRSLVVIYWRDIPAQVTAGPRSEGHSLVLAPRFQQAIDRAAVVAGATTTERYVAEWRRETEPLAGDPATAAATRLAQLEASHPDDLLEQLVRDGGWRQGAHP